MHSTLSSLCTYFFSYLYSSCERLLFVEGSDDNSIDKIIIDALFRNNEIDINVKPLGASFHIRSVAEALHPHHPEYYFIIDRDHCSEQEIENTWANFPDQAKKNLLIWRKREIENYFLSIDYLMQSSYIYCGAEQIQNHLLDIARQRVFLEAANYVIVGCREKFKSNWIQIFDRVSEFTTRNDALQQLISMSEFSQYQQDFAQHTDSSNLERELDQILRSFRGESEDLVIGCGNWINLMRGKELLPTLISRCFRVKDESETILQGKRAKIAFVKDLLAKDLDQQPEDFQQLCELVRQRIISN